MKFSQSGESVCPVAQTLSMIGERWTMLVLRELFMGSRRFEEFQMYTNMSPHILSIRLKNLETNGIIKRKQYEEHPPRFEYKLTSKGLDLFPLVVSLKMFGDKWGKYKSVGDTAITMRHSHCGHTTGMQLNCTSCSEAYGARDTAAVISPVFQAERDARRLEFLTRKRPKALASAD